MANPEHLEILRKGVKEWNEWRKKPSDLRPDLNGAELSNLNFIGADLSETNLAYADLCGTKLLGADLHKADLRGANLSHADLQGADLNLAQLGEANISHANLNSANLNSAGLWRADLSDAILDHANLRDVFLNEANLSGASLFGSQIIRAFLVGTDFRKCRFGMTLFAASDLSFAKSLHQTEHTFPSNLTIDTLYISQGNIPDEFLRGAGVPEDVITYLLPTIRLGPTIQWYSCFISHSTRDKDLADLLYARLKAKNVRTYYAPEDLKGGEKLIDQLERAIQLHDRLLIVLSDHSIMSEWVMTEIRRAREAERKEGRRKLFPIRLTDFNTLNEWKCPDSKSGQDLAEEVRQYFIPDFSNWRNHDDFEKAFDRLLRDLKAEEAFTREKCNTSNR